jgi:hypothetical protein
MIYWRNDGTMFDMNKFLDETKDNRWMAKYPEVRNSYQVHFFKNKRDAMRHVRKTFGLNYGSKKDYQPEETSTNNDYNQGF